LRFIINFTAELSIILESGDYSPHGNKT
jgi:hypothetical protein